MKRVVFLPVIPHSETKHSTAYSTLRNFEDMRKQLGQQSFPVISGEVVHQVIMEIALSHPLEFPNLFPTMGTFHMTEASLHCGRKYFKDSGIDIAFILTKYFGCNTIESMLFGGQYAHSVLRMKIIKKGFRILKWKEFCAEYTSDEWLIDKDVIKKLPSKLCLKVSKDVIVVYDQCVE